MNPIQNELMTLAKDHDLGKMSYRQIAKLIGKEGRPQLVKHHLEQLDRQGLMQVNLKEKVIRLVKKGFNKTKTENSFYSLPIVGSANCGPATIFADESVQGYLRVSANVLPRKKQDLYVLVADGGSMDRASLKKGGPTIEDGDFVVVDSSKVSPKDGEVVVAVIDRMATIKRYKKDPKNHRIILQPESTENYFPIIVQQGDNFQVSGTVIDIIKKAK
ncbi:MAG: S24 family peptidase [Patescibacteria group bacterium]